MEGSASMPRGHRPWTSRSHEWRKPWGREKIFAVGWLVLAVRRLSQPDKLKKESCWVTVRMERQRTPAAEAGHLGLLVTATAPVLFRSGNCSFRPCSSYCPAPLSPMMPGHVAQIPILLILCATHSKSPSTQTGKLPLTSKTLTHTNIQTFRTLCMFELYVPFISQFLPHDAYEHGKASINWSKASWIPLHLYVETRVKWEVIVLALQLDFFREVTRGTDLHSIKLPGMALAVQWLRLALPVLGSQVLPLVGVGD